MVRFARAGGSKGSNKRVLEEATPWSEMVSQMKRRKEVNPESIEEDFGNGKEETEVEKDKSKWVSEFLNRNTTEEQEEDDTVNCDEGYLEEKSLAESKIKKKKGNVSKEDTNYVIENGQKFHVSKDGEKRPWFVLPYEENERMTQYEGFWIKREMVKKLNELRETLNDSMDADSVKKKMMKAKRKAHKELIRELIYEQKDAAAESSDKKNNTSLKKRENLKLDAQSVNRDDKLERVLFDGYWVKKEGATRLNKLKGNLLKKGVSKQEVKNIMKNERRKEEKALRRETKRVCLRCRRRGHLAGECPEVEDGLRDKKISICYKCGSTEHKVTGCPQAHKEDFPLATCFICKRVGHISRQCPDNPRGLYPNGGSCRACGSVVHLVANCPVAKEKQEKTSIKIGCIDGTAVESLDNEVVDSTLMPHPSTFRKQKPKIIVFD